MYSTSTLLYCGMLTHRRHVPGARERSEAVCARHAAHVLAAPPRGLQVRPQGNSRLPGGHAHAHAHPCPDRPHDRPPPPPPMPSSKPCHHPIFPLVMSCLSCHIWFFDGCTSTVHTIPFTITLSYITAIYSPLATATASACFPFDARLSLNLMRLLPHDTTYNCTYEYSTCCFRPDTHSHSHNHTLKTHTYKTHAYI